MHLERLFNLIIDHYEIEYHQKRRRKRKQFRSRAGSVYTGYMNTDGYTMVEQDFSFGEKSISHLSKSHINQHNQHKSAPKLKSILKNPKQNEIKIHHHYDESGIELQINPPSSYIQNNEQNFQEYVKQKSKSSLRNSRAKE